MRTCSFCGAYEIERAVLVVGVNVGICDVCVDDCVGIIAAKKASTAPFEPSKPSKPAMPARSAK